MDANSLPFWDVLVSVSECSNFKEQADMFRYFAHVEALNRTDALVERFLSDLPKKLEQNHSLTLQAYYKQCEGLVWPVLFQPPLFPCKNYDERKYYNDLFSNWQPWDYVFEFCRKMKIALNIPIAA